MAPKRIKSLAEFMIILFSAAFRTATPDIVKDKLIRIRRKAARQELN